MADSNVKTRTKDLTLTAVFAAILCVISPFTVPIGPVGITLATFGVYLAGAVLGWKRASAAVAVYLLLGFIGLPIFSGFVGGIQRLAGPTGGYLVGYVFMAAISGAFADLSERDGKAFLLPLGMAAGTAVLYAFGTAWFCVISGSEILPALSACVLPFIPGDAVKIICATALGRKVRGAARR